MASHYEAPIRKPLVTGNKTYHQISVDVAKPIEGKANKQWWIVFSISLVSFFITDVAINKDEKINIEIKNFILSINSFYI